jgi:hypothetical protein
MSRPWHWVTLIYIIMYWELRSCLMAYYVRKRHIIAHGNQLEWIVAELNMRWIAVSTSVCSHHSDTELHGRNNGLDEKHPSATNQTVTQIKAHGKLTLFTTVDRFYMNFTMNGSNVMWIYVVQNNVHWAPVDVNRVCHIGLRDYHKYYHLTRRSRFYLFHECILIIGKNMNVKWWFWK